MAKPPLVSGQAVVRALKRAGWVSVSQKGSHIKLKRFDGEAVLIVPNHREIDRWTLKSILNAAEMSVEKFVKLL
jgi:predicted RNA binding protein YcfA (HicA-like mRNA interferase family)